MSVLLLKRCSVQNHTNNLRMLCFFLASRNGVAKNHLDGKTCRTQFSFDAERKIKWIPLKQNAKKNGTKNTTQPIHVLYIIDVLEIHLEIRAKISSAIVIRCSWCTFAWDSGLGFFVSLSLVRLPALYNDIICSQTLDCDLMCNQIAFRSNGKENSIRISPSFSTYTNEKKKKKKISYTIPIKEIA